MTPSFHSRCAALAAVFLGCLTTMSYAGAIAGSVTINIDSGASSLSDSSGTALNGGSPTVAKDGMQVVLGYFADGTAANPFGVSGDAFSSFRALTGPGTPFGINFTIGDDPSNLSGGSVNGQLATSLTISTGIADSLLPVAGTPLVLRIYNSAIIATATGLLDLSNASLWQWVTPLPFPPQTISINLDDSGLVVRGIGASNHTAIATTSTSTTLLRTANVVAAPEPAGVVLLASGALFLLARRRKH